MKIAARAAKATKIQMRFLTRLITDRDGLINVSSSRIITKVNIQDMNQLILTTRRGYDLNNRATRRRINNISSMPIVDRVD